MDKEYFKYNLLFCLLKDKSVNPSVIRYYFGGSYELAYQLYIDIVDYQIKTYGEQLSNNRAYLKKLKYGKYVNVLE